MTTAPAQVRGGRRGDRAGRGRGRKFLRNKKQEWEEYRSQVTPFELMKSLPVP